MAYVARASEMEAEALAQVVTEDKIREEALAQAHQSMERRLSREVDEAAEAQREEDALRHAALVEAEAAAAKRKAGVCGPTPHTPKAQSGDQKQTARPRDRTRPCSHPGTPPSRSNGYSVFVCSCSNRDVQSLRHKQRRKRPERTKCDRKP